MATLPNMQAPNPNQASGASLNPLQYGVNTTLGSTTPAATATVPNTQTGPGASTAGQPFGGVSTTLPTTTSGSTPSISSGLSTQGGSNTALGDFQATYGKGTGTQLYNTLAGLGTSTNAAVQATNAQVLDAASKQYANIQAQQAAAGISPDSSAAALAAGDFNSQVNLGLQATDAQLEQQGLNTLISSLTGEGQAHGGDVSGWDTFGNVMSSAGSSIGSILGELL